MKVFILSVMLLLCLSWYAGAQPTTSWQPIFPYPTGNNLYTVHAIDSANILIGGGGSTILSSNDAGNHWKLLNFVGESNANEFYDIAFTDDSVGVAVGHNNKTFSTVIVRTTDKGQNWTKVYDELTGFLYKAWFIDQNIGFAVGSIASIGDNYNWNSHTDPIILRTTNGGNNWTRIGSLPINFSLRAIGFFDDSIGVAIGDSEAVIRTTNGGINWSMIPLPYDSTSVHPKRLFVLGMVTSSSAIICGYHSGYYKTTDRGASWILSYAEFGGGSATSALFVLDTMHAYTGMNYGNFWRTTNGGVSWTQHQNARKLINDIVMTDSNTGFLVADEGLILRTTNNWESFSYLGGEASDYLMGQSWINEDSGYVCGYNMRLMKTSNGGKLWSNTAAPDLFWGAASHDIDFYSFDLGVDVGDPFILRSTNGGGSWSTRFVDTTFDRASFDAVDFVDSNTVYVCGSRIYSGKPVLWKSTDAGETWTPLPVPLDSLVFPLQKVKFLDANIGYIVGNGEGLGRVCFKTTDGGSSWNNISPTGVGLYGVYNDVSFLDEEHGYIAGGSCCGPSIFRTSDGGTTWTELTHPFINALETFKSVRFIDYNRGFVSLLNVGTILYTADAGATWSIMPTTASSIEDLEFTQKDGRWIGYAVGSGIYCTVLSPLGSKVWTGSVDSSWSNASNWSPAEVPLKTDSVVIPSASFNPVIYDDEQQIAIGKLTILNGGHLTVTDNLNMFIVKGDVDVQGTLTVREGARTNFIVGGSWSGNPASMNNKRGDKSTVSNKGFVPAGSTVLLTSEASVNGTFYNLLSDTTAEVTSSGNIEVRNKCTLLNQFTLRDSDTLYVNNSSYRSLYYNGKIPVGTIKRGIENNSTEAYRFESEESYVKFGGTGTYPEVLSMRARPNTSPRSFTLNWEAVPCTLDTAKNTVRAENVNHFSRWAFGTVKPNSPYYEPRVDRMYEIIATSSGAMMSDVAPATVELRYDEGEITNPAVEDSLVLLRGPIVIGSVNPRWNMVSLPVVPEATHKDSLFPTATSNVWSYNGSYQSNTTLQFGKGYWAKFGTGQEIAILGEDKETFDIPVTGGWHLIGSMSYGVYTGHITSTPPGIISSSFYGYNGGYVPQTTLEPMRGYWVKTSSAGTLHMISTSQQPKQDAEIEAVSGLHWFEVHDADGNKQKLYYGREANEKIGEMPPRPPSGIFDVRYESNRIAEYAEEGKIKEIDITVRSAKYPLKVRWMVEEKEHGGELNIGGERIKLTKDGMAEVRDESQIIRLILSPAGEELLPQEYALGQNYPNPFNPVTMIKYQLPEESKVLLTLYNVLGQKVATLIDRNEEAGYKTVEWNAGGLASGVYMYRLEAQGLKTQGKTFTEAKKLLLMK